LNGFVTYAIRPSGPTTNSAICYPACSGVERAVKLTDFAARVAGERDREIFVARPRGERMSGSTLMPMTATLRPLLNSVAY
jgi:hypothetical protein